jgi:hypothetical protein
VTHVDILTDDGGTDTVDFSTDDQPVSVNLDSALSQPVDHAGNSMQLLGTWESAVGTPRLDTFFVTPLAGVARTIDGGGGGGRLVYDAAGTAVTVAGGVIDHPTLGNVTAAGITSSIVNQPPIVIDDGDAGYTTNGFVAGAATGFGGDHDTSSPGANKTATWSFTGLEPGIYAVAATWTHAADRATDAPFTVRDGTATGTVRINRDINQEVAPNDFTADAFGWETLGVLQPTGTSVTVQLTDVGANQLVVADAVRLVPLGPALWPGGTVPSWFPDPAAFGIQPPPPAGLLSLTIKPGQFVLTALPSVPPAGTPPVTGYFVGLRPHGQIIDTPSLPLTVDADDDAGPVRVRLYAHSLVSVSTALELFNEPTCGSGFPDVPATHGFCDEIDGLAERGITGGYVDGKFHPTDSVSRQGLSAFFHRAAGEPPLPNCTTAPFTDVPASHLFCETIEWMVDEGITTGFVDGTFQPTAVVSRQVLATWFHRFDGAEVLPECTSAPFTDVPASHPFCPEITWAVDHDIIGGFPDGSFKPTAPVSRQAAAAFFDRYLTPA